MTADHPTSPALRWARAQKRLPLAAKAVLILIAQEADGTGEATIKPDALGAALGMNEQAVFAHLRALIRSGHARVATVQGGVQVSLSISRGVAP